MKRPSGAELRIRRNGEQKVGSVHTKMTQPKTFPDRGYYPPKENLTQSPQSSRSFKNTDAKRSTRTALAVVMSAELERESFLRSFTAFH